MIYLVTALLLFLLSLIVNKDRTLEKPFLIVAAIWLMIHDGFRWEIGTDWDPYYDFFMYGKNDHMGFTYTWINEFIKQFTNSYSVFIIIIAIITYSTLALLFQEYSPNAIMSILIYYCIMMGSLGCNRQILAIIICIISLKFIFERKLTLFILFIVLAVSLHFASAIFLPAYFLYGKHYSDKTLVFIILTAFLIGLSKLVNRLPFSEYLALIDNMNSGSTALTRYFDVYDSGVSIMGSIKRLFFVFLAIRVRCIIKNEYYNYFLILYSVGCVIFLLFNGSVLQIFAGRGAAYYNIFETIVIPFMIMNIPLPRNQRVYIWAAFFMLYLYLMWRDMDYYIMVNGVDIYRPYKSILF
jgi:hypothetical protein